MAFYDYDLALRAASILYGLGKTQYSYIQYTHCIIGTLYTYICIRMHRICESFRVLDVQYIIIIMDTVSVN